MKDKKSKEKNTGKTRTESKEPKPSPDIRKLSDDELEIVAGGFVDPIPAAPDA